MNGQNNTKTQANANEPPLILWTMYIYSTESMGSLWRSDDLCQMESEGAIEFEQGKLNVIGRVKRHWSRKFQAYNAQKVFVQN